MTADYLKNVERTYRSERADLETAREQRNAAVRQAIREGWTHAQIAEATGLTRGRIGQIAQTGPKDDGDADIDRRIVEGYTRHPQEDPLDAEATAQAIISAEPWE